ncbi:MAG: hypothetical protein GY754_29835 [bacterium]|nr:hypothetical protein [bacterium]
MDLSFYLFKFPYSLTSFNDGTVELRFGALSRDIEKMNPIIAESPKNLSQLKHLPVPILWFFIGKLDHIYKETEQYLRIEKLRIPEREKETLLELEEDIKEKIKDNPGPKWKPLREHYRTTYRKECTEEIKEERKTQEAAYDVAYKSLMNIVKLKIEAIRATIVKSADLLLKKLK